MATVTREIAERHNETAEPMDLVSGEQLRSRVVNKEHGRPDKCRIPTDKPAECGDPPQPTVLKEIEQSITDTFTSGAKVIKAANTHVGKKPGGSSWGEYIPLCKHEFSVT